MGDLDQPIRLHIVSGTAKTAVKGETGLHKYIIPGEQEIRASKMLGGSSMEISEEEGPGASSACNGVAKKTSAGKQLNLAAMFKG